MKLKGVLAKYGISQSAWAGAVLQANGRPMSEALATRIVNWDFWPTMTPRHSIEEQTVAFLREKGVPDEAMEGMWDEDTKDRYRGAKPRRTVKRDEPRGHGAQTGKEHTQHIPLPENDMLSQSAKKHFSLFKDPFRDDVQSPDDVFLSPDQRYVREAMFMAARQGGFLAVVGESGAGKTVLRRDLIDRIRREGHPISCIQPRIIDKGRLTAGAICDAIIQDISRESPRRSLESQARQIERLLTESSRVGNFHVLIIEEAHDLALQTLKYLKRFWELEDGFRKLLAIIMTGQPELLDTLDERRNPTAREVIRRCEIAVLEPLNGSLEDYLALKFKRVGKDSGAVFETDTFDAIRSKLTRENGVDSISSLYPLIVNNVTVKCMNLAAEIGSPKVNAGVVQEVFSHAR